MAGSPAGRQVGVPAFDGHTMVIQEVRDGELCDAEAAGEDVLGRADVKNVFPPGFEPRTFSMLG